MNSTGTRCRLLPVFGAVALLVLLVCESGLAEDMSTTVPTTSSGLSGGGPGGGRGNIIIGGAFGLVDRARRQGRRSEKKRAAEEISFDDIDSGRRRKNKRRGRKGNADSGDLANNVVDMDEDELSLNIDILADANQNMLDQSANEQRRDGRVRGAARKYFGGMGRDIVRFPNKARESINEAVSDMLGGVNTVLRMIPYDEIESTALRVAEYVQGMIDSGVPGVMLDSLMSSRVGGATETLAALVEFQGSPEELEPILEDIASNYRGFFKGAAGEVENFLSLLLPGRSQSPTPNQLAPLQVGQLPPIELDDADDAEEADVNTVTTTEPAPAEASASAGDEE